MNASKKVADIVGEIAAASKEQSEGIGQVTSAVSQMDQVTQQNAATSEETAAAAEELSSQAESLKDMVNELKQMVRGVEHGTVSTGKRIAGPARTRALPSAVGQKLSVPKQPQGPQTMNPEDVIPLGDGEF